MRQSRPRLKRGTTGQIANTTSKAARRPERRSCHLFEALPWERHGHGDMACL